MKTSKHKDIREKVGVDREWVVVVQWRGVPPPGARSVGAIIWVSVPPLCVRCASRRGWCGAVDEFDQDWIGDVAHVGFAPDR